MDAVEGRLKVRWLLLEEMARAVEIVVANDPTLREEAERDIYRGLLSDTATYYACIEEGKGEVVGITGYEEDRWGASDIYWGVYVYVDPKWHRRGIGTLLLEWLQEELKRVGCRKIYVDVGNESEQKDAIAFYYACGFALEGHLKDYWEDGKDFLVFGKRLA